MRVASNIREIMLLLAQSSAIAELFILLQTRGVAIIGRDSLNVAQANIYACGTLVIGIVESPGIGTTQKTWLVCQH